MNERNKATILVHSCDSYSDVWDPFFSLLNRYWADCPYDIVINTESASYDSSQWNNLNIRTLNLFKKGEKVPYGKRVKAHCMALSTEYVITIMDDFFVRSKVDTEKIEQIIRAMDEDKRIGCVCLVHHNDPYNVRYMYQEKEFAGGGYSRRPRFCHFAHDMQVSIWRTEAYIQSWKDFESPWEWESVSNARSFDDGWRYYDKDCYTPFAIDYIDYKKDEWSGIRKGKWVRETVEDLFAQNGIVVDYRKRGFFDANKDTTPLKRTLRSTLRELRCYGLKRCIPAFWFTLRRILFKPLGKQYPDNYCDYLRNKYYEKR